MAHGAAQKSRDTLAETRVRDAFRNAGLGHFVAQKTINLPNYGKRRQWTTPDFLFDEEMIAVFVDGCYWHGCPDCFQDTITNTAEWRRKRAQNRARDQRHSRALESLGYRVLRVWEHEAPEAAATAVQGIIDTDQKPGTFGLPRAL